MLYLERFIAFQYLKKRQDRMISVITFLSILGIGLGVAALIVTLSIMNGFERDLKSALIGANAHLSLSSFTNQPGVLTNDQVASALKQKEIKAYAPYIFRQALILSETTPVGVLVRGLDLEKEAVNSELLSSFQFEPEKQNLSPGVLLKHALGMKHKIDVSFSASPFEPTILGKKQEVRQEFLDGIILGSTVARNLKVKVGGVVKIFSPESKISPLGPLPRVKKMFVAGIYQSGLSGYDEILAFVGLPVAQKIFNMPNQHTAVAIYTYDPYQVQALQEKLEELLPFPYGIRTWIDDNFNLFRVLTLEKYSLAIILLLIVLIAAFNIISSLIMLVQEKKRDIALLKSLGMKDRNLQIIFMIQGSVLGIIGTFAGILFGLLVCVALKNYTVIDLPTGVYVKNKVPIEILPWQVLLIAFLSFLGLGLEIASISAMTVSTEIP